MGRKRNRTERLRDEHVRTSQAGMGRNGAGITEDMYVSCWKTCGGRSGNVDACSNCMGWGMMRNGAKMG